MVLIIVTRLISVLWSTKEFPEAHCEHCKIIFRFGASSVLPVCTPLFPPTTSGDHRLGKPPILRSASRIWKLLAV